MEFTKKQLQDFAQDPESLFKQIDDEVSVVRCRTKRPYRHFYVVRPAAIAQVTGDPERFSAHHYDYLMDALGSSMRLMPGKNDAARIERRDTLHAALGEFEKSGEAWLAQATRQSANRVLRILSEQEGTPRRFNFVREYAYAVPYLVFTEFFGAKFPVRRDGITRALLWGRNRLRKGPPLRAEGIQYESFALGLWSQVLFAHLFGNYDRGAILTYLAKCKLQRLENHFAFLDNNPDALSRTGFFAALHKANNDREEASRLSGEEIRALQIEFLTSAAALPGTSLSNLVGMLHTGLPLEDGTTLGFDAFLDRISNPDAAVPWKTQFDELYRFAPLTPRMDRVATEGAELEGYQFQPGDRITLDFRIAAFDPGAFKPDPQRFHPQADPARPYVEFRPESGHTRCFGRNWALTMQREMLLALDGKFKARPVKGRFGNLEELISGLPDRMMFEFCEEAK